MAMTAAIASVAATAIMTIAITISTVATAINLAILNNDGQDDDHDHRPNIEDSHDHGYSSTFSKISICVIN